MMEELETLWSEATIDDRMWMADYFWNRGIDRKLEHYKPSRWETWLNQKFGVPLPTTCEIFKKHLALPSERCARMVELEKRREDGVNIGKRTYPHGSS